MEEFERELQWDNPLVYPSSTEQHAARGITLLDHFAGLAMQVLLRNDETSFDEDAEDAYLMAKAMLRARGYMQAGEL